MRKIAIAGLAGLLLTGVGCSSPRSDSDKVEEKVNAPTTKQIEEAEKWLTEHLKIVRRKLVTEFYGSDANVADYPDSTLKRRLVQKWYGPKADVDEYSLQHDTFGEIPAAIYTGENSRKGL